MTEINKKLGTKSETVCQVFDEMMVEVGGELPWEGMGLVQETVGDENQNQDNMEDEEVEVDTNSVFNEVSVEEQELEDEAVEDILISHVNSDDADIDETEREERFDDFNLVDDAHYPEEIETVVQERIEAYNSTRTDHGHFTRSRK
jgi:hypothetical protein